MAVVKARASAPRFWNQGKAWAKLNRDLFKSLCSAVLESRQSMARVQFRGPTEPLLRGFGIKAKLQFATLKRQPRASAPRFWNQGKADIICGK